MDWAKGHFSRVEVIFLKYSLTFYSSCNYYGIDSLIEWKFHRRFIGLETSSVVGDGVHVSLKVDSLLSSLKELIYYIRIGVLGLVL